MADVVDKITRSRMMAGIRGTNTQPEIALRLALHRLGYRYRLHVRTLPGRPDVVLPRHRAIIQIHGCFWHRHQHCKLATTPSSNSSFWENKFKDTIERDKRNLEALQLLGWRSAVIWECAIEKSPEVVARKLHSWLSTRKPFIEIPTKDALLRASTIDR